MNENNITVEDGLVVETKSVKTEIAEFINRKKSEAEQYQSIIENAAAQIENATLNLNRVLSELEQLSNGIE